MLGSLKETTTYGTKAGRRQTGPRGGPRGGERYQFSPAASQESRAYFWGSHAQQCWGEMGGLGSVKAKSSTSSSGLRSSMFTAGRGGATPRTASVAASKTVSLQTDHSLNGTDVQMAPSLHPEPLSPPPETCAVVRTHTIILPFKETVTQSYAYP